MKVRINRQLTAGSYLVNFEVSDFTSDELGKMSSFGVPTVALKMSNSTGTRSIRIAVNQIQKAYTASFATEEEAKEYEDGVINQIKAEMFKLRQREDNFTSNNEVDL